MPKTVIPSASGLPDVILNGGKLPTSMLNAGARLGPAGTTCPAPTSGSSLAVGRRVVLNWGFESSASGNVPAQNYTAFPTPAICPNGDILTAYSRSVSHNSSDCKIVLRRSTNGGNSWGIATASEVTLATAPATNGVLGVLPSGRIVACWYQSGGTAPYARKVWVNYSDDNGVTWSSPSFIVNTYTTNFLATGSGAFALPGTSTVLLPVYGANLGETRYTSFLLESTDLINWSLRGIIAQDPNPNGLEYEEPQVGILDDTSFAALVRSDTDTTIYSVRSTDWGVTWETPVNAFPGYGWPAWKQLSTGTIVACSRYVGTPGGCASINDTACYGFYRISRDRMASWGAAQPIDSARQWYYLYAGIIEPSPGVAGILHSQGNPSSLGTTITEYCSFSDAPATTTFQGSAVASQDLATQRLGVGGVAPATSQNAAPGATILTTINTSTTTPSSGAAVATDPNVLQFMQLVENQLYALNQIVLNLGISANGLGYYLPVWFDFDARDLVGTLDGTSVSLWPGRAYWSRSLSTLTSFANPRYRSTGVTQTTTGVKTAGYPCVDFVTGVSNARLGLNADIPAVIPPQPLAVFYVGSWSTSSGDGFLFDCGNSAGTVGCWARVTSSPSTGTIYCGSYGQTGKITTATAPPGSLTNPALLTFLYNGSSSQIRLNGSALTTTPTGTFGSTGLGGINLSTNFSSSVSGRAYGVNKFAACAYVGGRLGSAATCLGLAETWLMSQFGLP